VDESQLSNMLSNTQPTLSWAASNGLSGSSLQSLTINAELAGYEGADLTAVNQFWGYDISGELVASSTYAGNSGGNTVCQVILENGTAGY